MGIPRDRRQPWWGLRLGFSAALLSLQSSTMDLCSGCSMRAVTVEPTTGFRTCSFCGVELTTDIFQSQDFTSDGRATGVLVREYGYRDLKICRVNETISNIISRLNLSGVTTTDVTEMISKITEGEFGMGEWFSVLTAACAYVKLRQKRVPLSMAQAAGAVGCNVHEIGRMVMRVLDHLDMPQLPEFDTGCSLERAIETCPCLSGIQGEKAEEMRRQGKFLLQCSVKWFLTTGRQPLPLVAAVVSFVADVNGVDVKLEDIANELIAGIATSKLRKKELMKTLVKAARVLLPWGHDVNVKNIVYNAPLLLRYMEIKSNKESFDLGTLRVEFEDRYSESEPNDSVYFDNAIGQETASPEEMGSLKLSGESLSSAYRKALDGCNLQKPLKQFGKDNGRKRTRGGGLVIDARMSRGSKITPSLDQVLERDVGYAPPPPSFVSGLEARKRRKERIEAAKVRIAQIVKPKSVAPTSSSVVLLGYKKDFVTSDKRRGRKKRTKKEGEIDWEDCIIELLLLHQVSEEEILQGHYRRLLDLHIFNSLAS